MHNILKIKHINAFAFLLLAVFFLPIANADLLYTWQEYGLFMSTSSFMAETVSNYGLWAWIGSYLTQFFYYPWLGSGMLIAMWIISYYLIASAFKMQDEWSPIALIPFVSLLISVVQVGYWIYYINTPGYCFSFSACYLIAALITWGVSKIGKGFIKRRLTIAAVFIGILFTIGYRIPSFSRSEYSDFSLCIPFIVAAASPVFLAIPYEKVKLSMPLRIGIMSGVFALMCMATAMLNFSNSNFHSEMKMYKALDESRYEDVLKEAQSIKGEPSNMMVVYKNIALLHTGKLTDIFKVNNCGIQPAANDSLNVRIAHISGEMVYYQFGQINFAYRWGVENGVKRGMTNTRLKMLFRCAVFNKEFDLAHKYLTLLKKTTFHKDWAKEHENWIMRGSDFFSSVEYENIYPLLDEDINYLDDDQSFCEKWILDHFSDLVHPTSSKLEDLIMCTALWTEDEYSFLVHFYDYYNRHKNEGIPLVYQEAVIMLASNEDSPITLGKDFRFDPIIVERFNNFAAEYQSYTQKGMEDKEIGKKLKPMFGDTYWWYYYFYTDFMIY